MSKSKMSVIRLVCAGILAASLCAVPFALTGCGDNASQQSASQSGAGNQAPTDMDRVEITIQFSPQEAKILAVDVPKNSSVLAALEATGLTLDIVDSQYGKYVKSIENKANEGMSGWSYTVNGQRPTKNAGDYTVASGDQIVWAYTSAEDTAAEGDKKPDENASASQASNSSSAQAAA